MSEPTRRSIVLVGAGHAHLYIAKRADRLLMQGVAVTLIAPGRFWYSGLATGMLGGLYNVNEDQVDTKHLIESRGGRFVQDRLVAVDRLAREVLLASGMRIGYDALSLNLGSEASIPDVPGMRDQGITVKPVARLWLLRQHLETRFRENGVSVRVLVVGGGASGCEVAANVVALANRHQARVETILVSRSDRLLDSHGSAAGTRVKDELEKVGVRVLLGRSIGGVTPGRATLSDGSCLEFDLLVVAAGLKAPELVGHLGVSVGRKGGILIKETLQSVDDPRIFAAGDCADLCGCDLPRYGVFAVRQAPFLLNNLLAFLDESPLKEYRPQRHWLSILNLGAGRGLATWGPFMWNGRLPMVLKDRIDRRFLALYTDKEGPLQRTMWTGPGAIWRVIRR